MAKNTHRLEVEIHPNVEPYLSLRHMVTLATHRIDQAVIDTLKPFGISVNQFDVIMTLMEFEGLSQVRISEIVQTPSYAMTRIINELEKDGLVRRQTDAESRRSFSVFLTEEGKALSPFLLDSIASVTQQVLAPLSTDEVRVLKRILGKVMPIDAQHTNIT